MIAVDKLEGFFSDDFTNYYNLLRNFLVKVKSYIAGDKSSDGLRIRLEGNVIIIEGEFLLVVWAEKEIFMWFKNIFRLVLLDEKNNDF